MIPAGLAPHVLKKSSRELLFDIGIPSDSSIGENVVDRYFLDAYGFKYLHFIMLNFCTWFRVDGSDCEEEEDALQ